MNREYYKWFSPHLYRDMELLVFGHSGLPVVFFPTRSARFYDYENWKIIDALRSRIEKGWLQVICVDSVDYESFYCKHCHPGQKIYRHLQYEQYILQEVLPLIRHKNNSTHLVAAGCSLGAYHAVNIAFKHPYLFTKVVGLSGRYDLTLEIGSFKDLFKGYRDENIYYNMPSQFIPNLQDGRILDALRRMEIIFAIGKGDTFCENNRQLSNALWRKGVHNALYIWEGEAHQAEYWQKMVKLYF